MSDFWEKKMRLYFKRIDFDHDGVITKKDFEGMADRFLKTGAFKDKQSQEALVTTLLTLWHYYAGAAGKDSEAADSTISQDDFVKSMRNIVADKDHPEKLSAPLPMFFHAVDSNSDHVIDGKEYEKFFEILGLDVKLAGKSFEAIDTNKDGNISLEEFKEAGIGFFTIQDDQSPTQFFWGPMDQ